MSNYPLSYPSVGDLGFNPTMASALGSIGGEAWPPEFALCSVAGGLFKVIVPVTVTAANAVIELHARLGDGPQIDAERHSIGAAVGQTVRVEFGPLHLPGSGLPPGDVAAAFFTSGCSVGAAQVIQLGWS